MSEENQTTSTSESANALGATEATTAPEPSWSDGLDAEYKESGFVKQFEGKGLNDFVKSAIHANSMVGADKIKMINEGSSDEDKNAFYNKLGRPETSDAYSIPDKFTGEDSVLDDAVLGSFRQKAHEIGLSDKQFAELIHFQTGLSETAQSNQTASLEQRDADWDAQLRSDFGQAYEQNVGLAQAALKHFGNEEVVSAINELGAGNHPELVKMLANVGKAMKSDSVMGDGQSASFEATPAEAGAQLQRFQTENYKALTDNAHPDHQRLKAEQKEMLNKVFGNLT